MACEDFNPLDNPRAGGMLDHDILLWFKRLLALGRNPYRHGIYRVKNPPALLG
jgi:hypothetical protein